MRAALVGLVSSVVWCSLVMRTSAQITPDRTLPQNSTVNTSGTTTVITGGTRAGGNLFHSFGEFSVPQGGRASFQGIDTGVQNVISRITGRSVSNINGVIETLGQNGWVSPANVFLINPNGIIFGANAALNVGGSFVATTGDRLHFTDGFQFRADGSQSVPLLTVSTPIGIQFGPTSGAIVNRSRANLQRDPETGILRGGLQVPQGRTLALLANGVLLAGGGVSVDAGNIEIGSVDASSRLAQVQLTPTPTGWKFGYEGVPSFQDIRLSQQALIIGAGAGGSRIRLFGNAIALSGESTIASISEGRRNGQPLQIQASQIQLDQFSTLQTTSIGSGTSGAIAINTRDLRLQGGAQISAGTEVGAGGDVTIRASRSINLSGQNSFVENDQGTGGVRLLDTSIASRVSSTASGRGGVVQIQTPLLRVEAGAQISATTFGTGSAGDVLIDAAQIDLTGVIRKPDGTPLQDNGRVFPSGIFAAARNDFAPNAGNGGRIQIQTRSLTVQAGATIRTTTSGRGDAGNILVRATDRVVLEGTAGAGFLPSSIVAASGGVPGLALPPPTVSLENITGRGGTVRIETGELRLANGAIAGVGSINPSGAARGAGVLEVEAATVTLQESGRLLAETASGRGGDIDLVVRDLLFLSGDSTVSTTAGRQNAGGDGGNLAIAANLIVASPPEPSSNGSDLIANAFSGTGGNIAIRTSGIFGIEPQQAIPGNRTNDIDASSQFGLSGTITITQLATDPGQGLLTLPNDVVDRSRFIAQGCTPGSGVTAANRSQFFVNGRGGLPPTPGDLLSSGNLRSSWVETPARLESDRVTDAALTSPLSRSAAPIPLPQEAQGWRVAATGTVVLTEAPFPISGGRLVRSLPDQLLQETSGRCPSHSFL